MVFIRKYFKGSLGIEYLKPCLQIFLEKMKQQMLSSMYMQLWKSKQNTLIINY